jgi:chemotaxis protein methyltransferase CheR
METEGDHDSLSFLRRLRTCPKTLETVISRIVVGETYFFRDPAHFQLLANRILPELSTIRASDHRWRVWSAGCASGEEAYSLAIWFSERGLANRLELLASDVSRVLLDQAVCGKYTRWSLRGPWAERVRPYLRDCEKGRWEVCEAVRRMPAFKAINLAQPGYPSTTSGTTDFDVIFCRNVLMYFRPETAAMTARRLAAALAPGGWLITGGADPPLAGAGLESVVTSAGVIYRRPLDDRPVEQALFDTVESNVFTADPVEPAPVVESTPRDDAAHWIAQVRAAANVDIRAGERLSTDAVDRFPDRPDLLFLRAVMLAELRRIDEAVRLLRHLLRMDETLAAGHYFLATLHERRGDRDAAALCYRRALEICRTMPPDEPVPLTEDEPAYRLAAAAEYQLAAISGVG